MRMILCALCLLASAANAAPVELASPDGQLRASIDVKDGAPSFTLLYKGRTALLPSEAGLDLAEPFEGGFDFVLQQQGRTEQSWRPVWGDRAEIPENCVALMQVLKEKGPRGRKLNIEWRLYNEGLAFRYRMIGAEDWKLAGERTALRFPDSSRAWAIRNTEDTFPAEPLPLESLREPHMMPLTIALTNGLYASVFEAFAVHCPRAKILSAGGTLRMRLLGALGGRAGDPFVSPWRAVLVGEKPGDLIEREYMILNLNPPCALSDTAWIRPGLAVSNEGSAQLATPELERIAGVCATNGFRYLQLDWGWYGTEYTWSDADRALFKKTNPSWADATDWLPNTIADPRRAAKGRVPYLPGWKDFHATVDLDLPRLIAFLKARGMGLCLYIRGSVLERLDMDALFAEYERWGLAGLKPGFVQYGSAEATDWNRKLVETAARHRLWLCVHDEYVPDGMQRTCPNLMLAEGGGGQEGNHPLRQDLALPFTRCLAGPFDFTPFIYARGKSHAHGVAFFLLYPGPSAVMRGGAAQFASNGPGGIGEEWEFVRRLPMTWDETRVLDAAIGRWLAMARRSGDAWRIAGMAAEEPHTARCGLGFLAPGKKYRATLFVDADAETDGQRAARKIVRAVASSDSLEIEMKRGGGFAGFIEPIAAE